MGVILGSIFLPFPILYVASIGYLVWTHVIRVSLELPTSQFVLKFPDYFIAKRKCCKSTPFRVASWSSIHILARESRDKEKQSPQTQGVGTLSGLADTIIANSKTCPGLLETICP
jgi:hypothetical protein